MLSFTDAGGVEMNGVFAASSMSLTSLLPRLFISMAVVITIMWIAARVLKNRQIPGSGILRASSAKQTPILQVVARQGMGAKTSVAIVRAGNKELVVGITENNISLLTELNAIDVTAEANSLLENAKTGAVPGDLHTRKLERRGTGALRATASAVPSSTTRKGLLESVREMTVRK